MGPKQRSSGASPQRGGPIDTAKAGAGSPQNQTSPRGTPPNSARGGRSTPASLNASMKKQESACLKLYLETAKTQGESAFTAGWIYQNGVVGAGHDMDKAALHYHTASQKGYDLGQYHLALMKLRGEGTAKNEKGAVADLQKAADGGLSLAMHALARCYWLGLGVGKDVAEARKWYQSAVDAGFEPAKERLAQIEDFSGKLAEL